MSSNSKYTKDEAYKKYRENPSDFFQEVIFSKTKEERDLINNEWPLFWAKYHYNLVENGIMEEMYETGLFSKQLDVIDIGSGTGHWIQFYAEYFNVKQIFGVDFTDKSIKFLEKLNVNNCNIIQYDITEPLLESIKHIKFDIINAIGIIFHIVDDEKWRKALINLSKILSEDGIMIIGGDFGKVTKERGIMRKNRSLLEWTRICHELNLQIIKVKRYDWWAGADNEGITNNLLIIKNM